MILFFAIFLIILALAVQKQVLKKSLLSVKEDYFPDENIVEINDLFHIVIVLKNTGRRTVPFVKATINIEESLSDKASKTDGTVKEKEVVGGTQASVTAWLKPHREIKFRIPVRAGARGRYVLYPLNLYGGDFLGLREQSRTYEKFNEVVAAPKASEDAKIKEVLGGYLGEVSARRFLFEDPVLTAGYREYTGREAMKQISWKQSARGRGLIVKEYDHTMEPSVGVLLNAACAKRPPAEVMESCYSIARTVCQALEDRRIPYDFHTNVMTAGFLADEGALDKGLGGRHFQAVLELLGRAADEKRESFSALLKECVRGEQKSGWILITPDIESIEEDGLAEFRRREGDNLLILTGKQSGTGGRTVT